MPSQRIVAIRLSCLSAVALLALAGCDAVDWGGAEVSVEPPPAPRDTAETTSETEPRLPPLPRGPLLFYTRLDPSGEALLSPVARAGSSGIGSLDFPRDVPDEWWARFDSTFLAPGRELTLHAEGRRLGSVVIDSSRLHRADCPPVGMGRALLPPGAPLPDEAFARAGETAGDPVIPLRPVDVSRRMRLFAPILAEQLLREAGEERPYLARRATLRAVSFPDDTIPGMAATYLINDTLAARPPSGSAASLVFLASREAGSGFQTVWRRVRRYGPDGGKRVYDYLTSLTTPAGGGEAGERLYLLRRFDARSARLAAGRARGEGGLEITWVEGDRCPVSRLPAPEE